MMEREKSYTRMYVYSFDSLASHLREYKVLRMSEFFGFSSTLLKPTSGIMKIQSEGRESTREESKNELDPRMSASEIEAYDKEKAAKIAKMH